MLNKIKFFFMDFKTYFFTPRLVVFLVFQFTAMHFYLSNLRDFSVAAKYPIAIWVLPFLFQSVVMQFVFGISIVYFFSTTPFFQYNQMYVVMRQGRTKWLQHKIIRIWLSALLLSFTEFLMSVILLFPRIDGTMEWGKLLYSAAMTNASAEYGIKMQMPYEIMNGYTPIQAMAILMITMVLVTGMIGTIMFLISLYVSRAIAVVVATGISVMSVAFMNLYRQVGGVSYFSPFSWLNILLLDGSLCKIYPNFVQMVMMILIIVVISILLLYLKIKTIDFSWTREE